MPIDAKKDAVTLFGHVVRCDRCGLGRSANMPRPEEIVGFYDVDAYYTHGETHMRPVTPGVLDKILVRLAWHADRACPFDCVEIARALPAGGTILDLGCGDGEKLAAFRDLGFVVLGVDPDPKSRALAASMGLEVLEGTAEAPPPAIDGRRFDLVIMSHSLEHCTDPVHALRNVRSLMADGGLAYIEVPNAGCLHFETFRQCSEMFDAPRHLWFFTPDALQSIAEQNGLRVVGWRYNGFTRVFTPTWRGWECEIFARLAKRGFAATAKRHSIPQSFRLLARSALARPKRKYDSIGILTSRDPAHPARPGATAR
ncbi:MAG: class I SAM-dependent methyltransferase [Sphingomonas sp.]|uniref:class I SAM-dependent methyltransferase n=1 Tax=Sphingomonas sp. TaxID=28214 RepID=UPI001B182FF6|nr:class I SAM-dependent methyltransferase [Sphingomonas sp.]MBO9623907.1 class I SAM-dependent methyltransferase [Sphingomonas sp.]